MVRRLSAGGTRIRTLGPSLWSCCFWREQERRNRRRGRSRRRCLPRGPSVRISFAPAIGLHHTSASLGPSDCTKLDRCSRAVAGLAAGSTAGVATRLSRRAFGCGLVSRGADAQTIAPKVEISRLDPRAVRPRETALRRQPAPAFGLPGSALLSEYGTPLIA